MIRPLRRAHRRAFGVLAVALPALLAAALLVRRPIPPVGALPDPRAAAVAWEPVERPFPPGPAAAFRARLLRDPATGDLAVEIEAADAEGSPELLVYWTTSAAPQASLPSDAVFLGVLRAGPPPRLPLPREASRWAGAVIVYSLIRGEPLAWIVLVAADGGVSP